MKAITVLAAVCITILSSTREVTSFREDFYYDDDHPLGYYDQLPFQVPYYSSYRNPMRPMYPSPLMPNNVRAPYPTVIDQGVKEREALVQIERLKRLYEQQQSADGDSEERFLLPSISFSSNSVTLSTKSFLSLLK